MTFASAISRVALVALWAAGDPSAGAAGGQEISEEDIAQVLMQMVQNGEIKQEEAMAIMQELTQGGGQGGGAGRDPTGGAGGPPQGTGGGDPGGAPAPGGDGSGGPPGKEASIKMAAEWANYVVEEAFTAAAKPAAKK